ncbi:ABC transporter ATP-binding protein [Paracoccus sp. MBLB3053]|uniref:ABC transporter ATP-binding protein n=1 Tax=Paracoccus aurantius TaxID=3073814 RepID=A0ABU2HUP0_9RHOB|nr:ABC transporter ATP-binding protein [Paracoccus sp. MBLB3053]MDS9468763.1 ABC transporter ATP-binding protein [Paracoccus sp. MBLB3053]
MIGSPAALDVRGLSARYGTRVVLRDVDLCIEPGEIFGLLGPNGAGKTSLVRAICGRLAPTHGTIAVAGRRDVRRAPRSIGLAPQEIALYPALTIRENLEVFGRLSGLTKKETNLAIEEACESADLVDRLGQRVEHLSGGFKRRVNIVAAILHRPALLILDEPTVGVDVDARIALDRIIQTLARRGMGVLLITHDLHQAEVLCARVGFLLNGRLAPQGPPRTLLEATFAGQDEIIVELAQMLSVDQTTNLQQMGFVATNSGQSWHLIGNRSLDHLAGDLKRAGIAPREMRFRKPGLDSLFLRLLLQHCGTAQKGAA